MNLKIVSTLFFVLIMCGAKAQEPVYNISWGQDGFLMGGGLLLNATSYYLKLKSNLATEQDLALLDRNNLTSLDRGATYNYSSSAATLSDYLSYGSAAIPFTLYFAGACKGEGPKIALMAVETYLYTSTVTNVIKATAKRFRPFNYNPNVSLDEKLSRGSRFSFVSGHTSNAAAMSFFTAKVISDLHPDSKWKPYIWGAAVTLPAVTGYLRYKGGKHFPTDVIGGYAIGAAFGWLIPTIHKNENLQVMSEGNTLGIVLKF